MHTVQIMWNCKEQDMMTHTGCIHTCFFKYNMFMNFIYITSKLHINKIGANRNTVHVETNRKL